MYRETDKQIDIEKGWADRQTDRNIDRLTDTQAERKTDR